MVVKKEMNNTDTYFDEWCKRIAEAKTPEELIAHFREHVSDHYDRHNREGETSLKIWLVGVFNFMYILEKKFPEITDEDKLFKLSTYHKNHEGEGPEPPFDIDYFLGRYDGDIKQFYNNRIK